MILTICKTVRKLRVLLIALLLLALVLSFSPVPPVRSSIPAHPLHTAIICLIGSICVDVSVNV